MTNFILKSNTTIPVTDIGDFMEPNISPTEEAFTAALKESYRLIETTQGRS